MFRYKEGDIVYGHVQFQDKKEHQLRLLVIVDQHSAVGLYDSFNITTKENESISTNIPVQKDDSNKLRYDSFVKLNVVYEINEECIEHKIGSLSEVDLNKVQRDKAKFEERGLIKLQPLHKNIEAVRQIPITRKRKVFTKEVDHER